LVFDGMLLPDQKMDTINLTLFGIGVVMIAIGRFGDALSGVGIVGFNILAGAAIGAIGGCAVGYFSGTGCLKGAVVGGAVGALAGATFGLSMAATGGWFSMGAFTGFESCCSSGTRSSGRPSTSAPARCSSRHARARCSARRSSGPSSSGSC
jgi:hypothetical protein